MSNKAEQLAYTWPRILCQKMVLHDLRCILVIADYSPIFICDFRFHCNLSSAELNCLKHVCTIFQVFYLFGSFIQLTSAAWRAFYGFHGELDCIFPVNIAGELRHLCFQNKSSAVFFSLWQNCNVRIMTWLQTFLNCADSCLGSIPYSSNGKVP